MRHDNVLLVEVGLGLGVVALSSIPALLGFGKQLAKRSPKSDTYEDEDGVATPESVAAFSNKWAKFFIFLAAGTGLGCQIAIALLATMQGSRHGMFLQNWLLTATWGLLATQSVALIASRSSVQAYSLGLHLATSSIATLVVLLLQNTNVLGSLLKTHPLSAALRIVTVAATAALLIASISLPRRPDVFFNQRVVDRMMTVNAYARFTFGWCGNVLAIAKEKRDLEATDLSRPDHGCRARDQAAGWNALEQKFPLWRGLLWRYKWPLIVQWVMCLVGSVMAYLPQYFTLQILRAFENLKPGGSLGVEIWFLAIWLGLSIMTMAIIDGNMFWIGYGKLGIPIRAELSGIIFEKAMRRKNVKAASKTEDKDKKKDDAEGEANAEETTESTPDAKKDGKDEDKEEEDDPSEAKSRQAVINLIGVDAKRVSDFAWFQFLFPNCITKLLAGIWFLVALLGFWPVVAGFSIWFLILPINAKFAKLYGASTEKLMKVRDQKLAIVNESLQGIRQIKFSALEPQWEKRILASRERELKACWDVFIGETALIGCWITSPIALAAASLAVYALLNGQLTPSVAFVAVGIFKSLEMALGVIPELTTDTYDCWVSIKRIEDYLKGPEINKYIKSNSEIAFERANIAWPVDEETDESERYVLRNVDLVFPKGEISVISGKTGTGKSLMLAAILGEADLLSGSVYVPEGPTIDDRHDYKANRENWILENSIAFVGQIPWIENASLRDNILFGLPFDEGRYEDTIEACALKKDLEILTDGDKTELGANGINLSGGQKWRLTLARAIYSRAGILVLDDIFSAVDAHVGRHLLEKCLAGDICKGRTRILVTHHVSLVAPKAKFIVELADGVVAEAGLTSDLEDDGTMAKIKSHEQSQQEILEDEAVTAVNSEDASEAEADGESNGAALKKVPSKTPQKFVEDETREKGAIKKKVYALYFKQSGGWMWWIFSLALFLSYQVLVIGRSWWLKIWTGTYEGDTETYDQHELAYTLSVQHTSTHAKYQPIHVTTEQSLGFYLSIYVTLALVSALLGTLRFFYMFRLSIKASRAMFEKMTFTVLRTPLRWVDTVPVGRILNRFTADFNIVDTRLAPDLTSTFNLTLNLIGICIAALFVSPYIILLAAVLLGICAVLADTYLAGARPVKRLESTTKSPIFELFGSALTGVSTIRSFDKMKAYIDRMNEKLDDYDMATWYLFLFARWVGWRMSLIGTAFSTVVTFMILATPGMNAALAGFTMSFALDFQNSVLWLIRQYASIELDMNAAERVLEYSELPTEDLGGEKAPAAWPTRGELEVNDLVVGYAPDLPAVLKGLTFSVRRNERVGVVGRTGAGKSSLTLALFRFLEPRSGTIHVDGLDISKISLHDLRSRLAIIPQDPVLFSGTVRSNLDPFDDHTDAELRDCLERVHLIMDSDSDVPTPAEPGSSSAPASTTPRNVNIFKNLASPIAEGGHNLSQGQRQLLCLARAIVARPKIMVLDEATSAVDMTTDALIQRSIREEFGDATLLVIAHRLSTIADFDRILVLSDGKVAEFGTPKELWSKGTSGVFRSMCEESGEKNNLKSIILGEGSGGK